MFDWIGSFTFNIIVSIVVIVIAFSTARWLPPLISTIIITAVETRLDHPVTERRRDTMRGLTRHLTNIVIGFVCLLLVLGQYVNTSGILAFVGLFTAALGVSAGRLVNDYVSGVIFIFEDLFNVGEKVEVFNIQGKVVDVNLRTTILRAPSGELYTVPNGDIRVVRNFGRGEFSIASVRVAVRNAYLDESIALLEKFVPTLSQRIPELMETPTILSEDGALGERIILTLFAKAKYGQGVEARRKLMLAVHEIFASSDIDINTA